MRSTLLTCILAVLPPSTNAATAISVLGELTREATLQPGSQHEGRIALSNGADQAQDVRVYQTDYLFYADGRNVYGDPGTAPRSNAKWITFSPRQLTVAPGETAAVYYKVNVPPDDALVGTYWSMLMIEPLGPSDPGPLKAEPGKATVGLRTVMRYGIQITTHVGDAGTRDLRFSNLRLVTDEAKHTLQVDVEGMGQQWLNPVFWVEVHDQKGGLVGRFEGAKTRLYPTCSACCQVELGRLAPGNYNALIVADNEDDNVFGARCTLDIP